MDGLPYNQFCRAVDASTSVDIFFTLRSIMSVKADVPIANATVDSAKMAYCILQLEKRGVLADVEQYLTGLYENTRRPGYAGTTKPLERAARDAAEGVQP